LGRLRGGGSLGGLVHDGGDRQWGRKVGKPEWWPLAGLEWLGRNSLAARSLGWGRWGPRMVGGIQRWGGAHGGRRLSGVLRLLVPSREGSSSGRGRLGVARWCTWAVVFNSLSAQRRHGVALRWVFDGESVGCSDDDLCREYGMVRHNGYGEHTRHGELQ
jgi:hypothetical protein